MPPGHPRHHRHFQEGSLVLDKDLIDLTMIPPPMTPDEVNIAQEIDKMFLYIVRLANRFN